MHGTVAFHSVRVLPQRMPIPELPFSDPKVPCLPAVATKEHSMTKPKKTAVDLQKMILDQLISLNECPHGISVSVIRLGPSWTALTLGTDRKLYADGVSRIAGIVDQLKMKYDLAA
jgi:hypothetical protein